MKKLHGWGTSDFVIQNNNLMVEYRRPRKGHVFLTHIFKTVAE